MQDQSLDKVLRDFEVTANNFAIRINRSASIRTEYARQIKEMSKTIRGAVKSKEVTSKRGAEIACELRNQILYMLRQRDHDLGKSIATHMKKKGVTLDRAIYNAMDNLKMPQKPLNQLSSNQQHKIYIEVIESSGRSKAKVTGSIPQMRKCARGLWLATFLVAAYNIGTAEDPAWQGGRESANIVGGTAGGFAAGAAMGAAGGIWAGPVGIAIGVVVGGVLGALLADHTYVESVGVYDPVARPIINQHTGFWSGVDEAALAQTLATKNRSPQVIKRTFLSLNAAYHTDVDDVACHFVDIAKRKPALRETLRIDNDLRNLLIQLLEDGWTSRRDQMAINYLNTL